MLLRWRRIFEFYDHSETRIRATAQVVFAGVVDSHSAQLELIELLSRVRDRWWLRLSPEDVDSHIESIMDPQTSLELPCPVRRRMHALRALIFLEEHFGSQLIECERNMAQAQHGEEQSAGLRRIEMANALAQAVAELEAVVVRCRFLAAGTLDEASAHAENRCERLEEGFVRERDCSAVADIVLADWGAQLREEQVMVSEFQDTALGMEAQVDEFVEQHVESTKRVIDSECSDVKKHERDLVENAEALAWHEESVATELCRELQQARMQVQQQRQLESAPVESMPECLGTLRTKAASDTFRVSSHAFGSSNDCCNQCGFLRVSMKSFSWLLREIVAENTKGEREIAFCVIGFNVPMVPYLKESCMSLSGMTSGPRDQTSDPARMFSSGNMSNEVRYKAYSLHKSVYIAVQRDHCVCFGSHSGSPVDPLLCNVSCPENFSQFCGGDNWYTFHLMNLWVAPVEVICSGMPEPVGNNMPMSMTVCLDCFNEIVPCISMCPSGQHHSSHEPVCDLLLRKWVVRQRCFEIERASVSHVAHAEVQSLCQEGTENGGCDIQCTDGYTVASNTLKCKAVDAKTALGTWTGIVSCTSKSCGVPPSFANTLHTSVERHYLDSVTYNCKPGYSLNGLHYGKKEFFWGCKSDGTYDNPHMPTNQLHS